LVVIVIVNWNSCSDTVECLESLLKISYSNYSITVVDNNSKDDSFEKLKAWSRAKKNISIIKTKENLGFAGGSNIGMRRAMESGADYVLLLNNDTLVSEEFLSQLVDTAESHEISNIIGAKILHYPDKRVWYASGAISWLRGGGHHPRKGRPDSAVKTDKPFNVSFITGCLMLIRRDVIEKIGFLDETYFLYNEDSDYCCRASAAGVEMFVNPRSLIFHKENSTAGGWRPYHIYYLIRNKLIFMERYAPNRAVLSSFYIITGIVGLLYFAAWVFRGRFDLVKAYMRAIKDYRKGIKGRASGLA